MKNLALFLLQILLLSHSWLPSQCNSESLSTTCISKLSPGFNFLKNYKVEGDRASKQKVEFSYVLTKGTQYMITICTDKQSADGISVTLFDSNRNKVATSKVDDQYLTAILFLCNKTEIYYLQYTFDNSIGYCGGSALGFRR